MTISIYAVPTPQGVIVSKDDMELLEQTFGDLSQYVDVIPVETINGGTEYAPIVDDSGVDETVDPQYTTDDQFNLIFGAETMAIRAEADMIEAAAKEYLVKTAVLYGSMEGIIMSELDTYFHFAMDVALLTTVLIGTVSDEDIDKRIVTSVSSYGNDFLSTMRQKSKTDAAWLTAASSILALALGMLDHDLDTVAGLRDSIGYKSLKEMYGDYLSHYPHMTEAIEEVRAQGHGLNIVTNAVRTDTAVDHAMDAAGYTGLNIITDELPDYVVPGEIVGNEVGGYDETDKLLTSQDIDNFDDLVDDLRDADDAAEQRALLRDMIQEAVIFLG